MERYSRQTINQEIGLEGQRKLKQAKVIVIGCGALGTVIANNLTRSGVGYIKIVDRDYIELSNLQRQILFDEEDIEEGLPKSVAAAHKLRKINSDIIIESEVMDVNPSNIITLCQGFDLILDGTDNFSIRYLINDVAIKLDIPWIYGGAIGTMGMVQTIIPDVTPCFRCTLPEIPAIGTVDTCDTLGVINSITSIIGSIQTAEAIKLLIGHKDKLIKELRFIDIWHGDYEVIPVEANEDCVACKQHKFEFLNRHIQEAVNLCGSKTIQINYSKDRAVSIDTVLDRLNTNGIKVKQNSFYSKFKVDGIQITLFNDGRAIIKGTEDISYAKSLYAKYIGL